jgi:hypothetical protein
MWQCVEVRWNYRLEEAADMDAEGQDEGPPCQALVVDCNEQMIGDVGSCPKTAPCLLS